MSSPLGSFKIEKLIGLDVPLFNISLYLTNNSMYILIAIGLMMVLYTSIGVMGKLMPTNLSLVSESLHASLLNMARSTTANQVTLPLLFSLFNTILILNLVSNVPFNYASTSALTFSLGLSLTVFIGVTVLAISIKG
jgi:F-type H+-transporting ATPase subunit a